jgi:hypothetical protein
MKLKIIIVWGHIPSEEYMILILSINNGHPTDSTGLASTMVRVGSGEKRGALCTKLKQNDALRGLAFNELG